MTYTTGAGGVHTGHLLATEAENLVAVQPTRMDASAVLGFENLEDSWKACMI